MNYYFILCWLFVFFSYNSCIFDSENLDNNQIYVFEVEYVNCAWGYQHNGFYINNEGNVFKYKYDYQDEPWKPKTYLHFSGIELENKYDHSKTYCNTIDDSIIEAKRKLIPYAMEGSYSDSMTVGKDMGGLAYICYSYNSSSDMYTPIILEMKGDLEYKNESDAAISLVKWLKDCCQEE